MFELETNRKRKTGKKNPLNAIIIIIPLLLQIKNKYNCNFYRVKEVRAGGCETLFVSAHEHIFQ